MTRISGISVKFDTWFHVHGSWISSKSSARGVIVLVI